jgi:hypothetical protein
MSRCMQSAAGSSLADFSTLKVEAIHSSETSVHARSSWRHIPEDGILHSHRCENLKSYMAYISYHALPLHFHRFGITVYHGTSSYIQNVCTHFLYKKEFVFGLERMFLVYIYIFLEFTQFQNS